MELEMIHLNANSLKNKCLKSVDQNDSPPKNHIRVPPKHNPDSLTSIHPAFLDSLDSITYVMICCPITDIHLIMQPIKVRLPDGTSM